MLLASFAMPSSVAWGADTCGSLDRVIIAIRLARVLYPELSGQEFSLQFSEGTGGPTSSAADVRSFLIAVDKPQWHPPGTVDTKDGLRRDVAAVESGHLPMPLFLQFSFTEPATLDSKYLLSCRPIQFLNENGGGDQMNAARAAINEHPEWSDARDVEEAQAHGMHFGPGKKAAILRRISLQKLSEFYGPLRVKTIEFSVASDRVKEPHTTFADLRWYVIAEEVGTSRALQITVESFGAEIDGISEYIVRK